MKSLFFYFSVQYLTTSFRATTEKETELFEEHRRHCKNRSRTSRGKLFWNKHPAKERLIEDTKSGKANVMTPKDLWKSHDDYQAFLLDDFRGHIYQERSKQLVGPYWQQKRNKHAIKKHDETVDKMSHEWNQNKWEGDMNDIISRLERI